MLYGKVLKLAPFDYNPQERVSGVGVMDWYYKTPSCMIRWTKLIEMYDAKIVWGPDNSHLQRV